MNSESMKPQIRFKGFNDAWEQHKLEAFGVSTSGTSIESEFSDYGQFKVISIGSYSEDSTYTDQGIRAKYTKKTKSRILNKDDLTMILNDKTASGRIIGRVLLIEKSDLYIYNQRTQRIEINKEKYNPLFIYEMLNAPIIRNKIFKQCQGNTQIYVNWSSIKQLTYFIPNLNEQKYIGYLFKNIDNLINLHQHKYDKLVNIKKSMLEKMFPKNGTVIPEIRFKGFNDTWEQCKLCNVTVYKNGIGHEDRQVEFGKYELVNLNSISIDGGLKPSGKHVNESNETLNKDDLVMVLSDVGHGNLLGRVALIPENNRFVLNQRVALLRPNNKILPRFLFSYINSKQSYFKKNGAGSSQLNISKECVENFDICVPKFDEQKHIGYLFKNIDNLITLHQRKLEKLQNIKKSLLTKMFV